MEISMRASWILPCLTGAVRRLPASRGRAVWLLGIVMAALVSAPDGQATEPPAEPLLRIEAGMHTAMIRSIDTDAAGRIAVTASDDKTARIWEVASGRLLRVLRPPIGPGNEGKLFAMAISPDGAVVAAAGWTGYDWNQQSHIYLLDARSGQLLRRLNGLPNVINHLAFSPDGRWLAATLWGKNGVRVWDWRQGGSALADSRYGDDSYGASWSTDGRLVVSSFDGKLRLYRPQAGSLSPLAEADAPGGKRPFGVAFSPDGGRVAVGYYDTRRVDVVDGNSLALQFSPSTAGVENGNLFNVAWSRDGQTLVAGGMWDVDGRRPVRRWPEAGRGKPVDTPTAGNMLMQLRPLAGGGWLVGWGGLGADGRWQARGQAPIADLRGSRRKAFQVDASGSRLQFGYEPGGQASHHFDLRTRQLRPGPLADGLEPRISGLAVENWINTITPTLAGKALKLEAYETSRSLAITPDGAGFALGFEYSLRFFDAQGGERWKQAVPGVVWGVNIPPQAKVVVAAYGDGTIRWHRLSDGLELLAFFPHADRQRWVLWTPSGYYDASPGAEDLIGWHLNRGMDQAADFFPASRFRSKFYRPDVIDRVLETLDEGAALRQADQAANRRQEAPVAVSQVLPPVVDLVSPGEVRSASTEVSLRVRGRSAADAPVSGWRIRVNGQVVPDVRGLGRQDMAAGAEREFTVTIPPQDSEIQVFAENRHGVSTPATLRVRWAGAAAPPTVAGDAFQIQPKLYVLAVGVAQYQHADIGKLNLPAKDARDFAAAMKRQEGKLYRQVEVKLLTDAQATRDDVVDGLEWLQKQVTQHDVGMVFIAGHGMNDPALGYTFLPVNADPDRLKRTGVTVADIRTTLSSLAGKALFFVDTCHAGNVLGANRRAGPNDISGVINELASAENGVVVFSSSTGRQYSLEDAAWGNGAFTKALVEGINGAAARPGNKRITHKMLDLYISDRVKQLTNGRQTPVTQAAGSVPDFPLALSQ